MPDPIHLANNIFLYDHGSGAELEFRRRFRHVWRRLPAKDRKAILLYAKNGRISFEIQEHLIDPVSGKPAWGLTSKRGRRVEFWATMILKMIAAPMNVPAGAPDASQKPLDVIIANELAHVFRWATGRHDDDRELEEKAANMRAANWGFDRKEWSM